MHLHDEIIEGMYQCPECHGSGLGKQNHFIQLLDICRRCGGVGKLDWVSSVVHSPPIKIEESAGYRAVTANIQLLKSRIIEEGSKMGIHITINLDFKNMQELYMQVAPPLVIRGGKGNVPY
jgi:hypothetical protein